MDVESRVRAAMPSLSGLLTTGTPMMTPDLEDSSSLSAPLKFRIRPIAGQLAQLIFQLEQVGISEDTLCACTLTVLDGQIEISLQPRGIALPSSQTSQQQQIMDEVMKHGLP